MKKSAIQESSSATEPFRLGHSDPKVTMRYAHLSAKALQDAASVIVRKPLVVAELEAKAA